VALYIPFTPTTAIGRAMFNFDMFGITNYKIIGLVRVSVSDTFSYADYRSTSYSPFNSALYTSASDEVPWTPSSIDGVKSVLATYSQFINLQFDWKGDYDYFGSDLTANPEDVGRAAVTDINISWINRADENFSGISGGSSDKLIFNYTGGAGDIFLNNAYLPFNLDANSYTLQTLIHELGHSLGLSHPHSGYNYAINVPTISADYAATQYLGFQQLGFYINSAADMYKEYFTVMSYDDQISTLANSNYVYRTYTPMILDVIALQHAYGEGAGTSGSGNDTINAGTAGYRTYFDTGGVDTVDLTSYTDAAYLNMGVSITGAAHLVGVAMSLFDAKNTIVDGGNPANLRWLYGEYENAIGSTSTDLIAGNILNNKIDGRAGDDSIFGEGGDDDISGGDGSDNMYGGDGNDRFDWDPAQRKGADTMEGGLGDDIYVLDSSLDLIVEKLNEGNDTVWVSFSASLSSYQFVENMRAFGDSGLSLIGNGASNVLSGGAGNDTMDGAGGVDAVQFVGNASNYTISKTAQNGTIIVNDKAGSQGSDTLKNIERLLFADKKVALDLDANAGLVAKILGAVFGSASVANKEYVGIGLGYLDAGMTYANLMQLAIGARLGGRGSSVDVVNLLYTNVVGSAPDDGALAYYKNLLDDGTYNQGTLGAMAADTSQNTMNINLVGLIQTGIEFI
jgi:serralysin